MWDAMLILVNIYGTAWRPEPRLCFEIPRYTMQLFINVLRTYSAADMFSNASDFWKTEYALLKVCLLVERAILRMYKDHLMVMFSKFLIRSYE